MSGWRRQDQLAEALSLQLGVLDSSAFRKVRAAFQYLSESGVVTIGSFCSGCEMQHWVVNAISSVFARHYGVNVDAYRREFIASAPVLPSCSHSVQYLNPSILPQPG
jgi:hypothetical protein